MAMFAFMTRIDAFDIVGSNMHIEIIVHYVKETAGALEPHLNCSMGVDCPASSSAGQINTAIENAIKAFAVANFGETVPNADLIYQKVSRG
jgi:hypothetical protein